MYIVGFWFKCHFNLLQVFQWTITQHWFRWGHGAEQATSHYLKQWWCSSLTHMCVIRFRWYIILYFINANYETKWCICSVFMSLANLGLMRYQFVSKYAAKHNNNISFHTIHCASDMATSCHGDAFRVTGPLWGESNESTGDSLTHLSLRPFEAPWHSRYVAVMETGQWYRRWYTNFALFIILWDADIQMSYG